MPNSFASASTALRFGQGKMARSTRGSLGERIAASQASRNAGRTPAPRGEPLAPAEQRLEVCGRVPQHVPHFRLSRGVQARQDERVDAREALGDGRHRRWVRRYRDGQRRQPRRTAGSQAVVPDRIVLRQRGPQRLRRRRIGARARDLPEPEPRGESLRGAGSNLSLIQRDGAVDLSLVRGMGGQPKPGLRGPRVGRIALDQRAEPARGADPIGAVGRTHRPTRRARSARRCRRGKPCANAESASAAPGAPDRDSTRARR